ncbi:MAG: hypothetical protein K0R09_370 [Clostridiales bacterium]|nr:hypothetical protein [Clostridiales bacterium]
MNWVKNTFFDVFKCIAIGTLIAIGIGMITGLIGIAITWGNLSTTIEWIKRVLYVIGGLSLFLSAGAFAQRDGTRPFIYNEQWKSHFKILNIGFVILIISFSVLIWGIMVHNFIDFGRVF